MPISDLTSKQAVLKAMAEFDRLGRDVFLARHRYGRSLRYVLTTSDGRWYDSKAIAGVAYGIQHPQHPLRGTDFSGGARTVKPCLEAMGFTVEVLPRGDRTAPRSPAAVRTWKSRG